jgi:hypothetical protein
MAISVPNQRHTLIQYGNYLDSRFPSGTGVGGGSMVDFNFDDRTGSGAGSFFDALAGANPTTEQTFGSGKALRCPMVTSADELDWLAGNPTHQIPLGGEIWVRFRTYFPTGFNFVAVPVLKFLRLQTALSGAPSGHFDFLIRYFGENGDTNNRGFFDPALEGPATPIFGNSSTAPPTGLVTGRWQTWNFYVKWHNVAASSKVRMWRDNKLLIDHSTIATLASASAYMGSAADSTSGVMFITHWNGFPPQDQVCYIDDWAVSSSISGSPTQVDSNGYPWIGMGQGGVS